MRLVNMLIVMTATVFVAAGSSRGSTSPGPLLLDSAAVTASGPSSSPMMKGGKSLTKTMLPAAPNFTVGQLFVAATAEDGKDDEKNPKSRSAHCPPDKDDHKGGDNQDKDKDKDKDKDHHENCGKGDDDKNP